MPRVIITTDPSTVPQDITVLLDESVSSVHLSSDHAASALVERIAWAINDAEEAEYRRLQAPPAPDGDARQRPLAEGRRGDRPSSRRVRARSSRSRASAARR